MTNLIENKRNYFVYVFIIALLSSLLWGFAKSFAMPTIMILCAIILLLKNDLRYGLPFIINVLFVNGVVAADTSIDIGLIVGGVILLLVLIAFVIRNRTQFKLGRLGKNTILLAILAVIPFIWCEYKTVAYAFLYLGWCAYLIIYLFFVNYIKEDIKEEFSYGMEGLAILLSLECLISVLRIYETTKNFQDIYTVGWGICNEAGIMLCVALPFIVYKFYTSLKTKEWILHFAILLLTMGGIVATLSRGTIFFGLIEIGALFLYMLLDRKYYKTTIVFVILGILCIGLFMIWKRDNLVYYALKIVDNNGRFELYNKATDVIQTAPYKTIFGAGIVFELDFKDAPLVCHSTIYETLAYMGVIGIVVLLYHFVLKYSLVLKRKTSFNMIMLLGFLIVDIYGLVDNTYHMYYYMIVMMMILAVVERSNNQEVNHL